MTEDPYVRDLDSAAYPHGEKPKVTIIHSPSYLELRIRRLTAAGNAMAAAADGLSPDAEDRWFDDLHVAVRAWRAEAGA